MFDIKLAAQTMPQSGVIINLFFIFFSEISQQRVSDQDSGQISISKPSNEEAVDQENHKMKNSFELFSNRKIKLFCPKIEGVQPKYFHKIKNHSLVIDISLISMLKEKNKE